jgi:ketopantoate hydroxymethyltransferase
LGDLSKPLTAALANYVNQIASGAYPAKEHLYEMPPQEKVDFMRGETF